MNTSHLSSPNKLERRLAPLLDLLQKQSVVQSVTHRQQQNRADVIENLLQRQQQAAIQREVDKLKSPDIAHLLEMITSDKRHIIWRLLSHEVAGEVLIELNEAIADSLIEMTLPDTLLPILETLDTDELSDIAELLPQDLLNRAKASLKANERNWLEQTMSFAEGSVGDIMSRDCLIVTETISINEAIELVRSNTELPPQTDKLFIVNNLRHVSGVLPLINLLRNPVHSQIEQCMDKDVVTFSPTDQAEEAGQAFERYDLISAPVVDSKGRIIGRLTVESIMDYLRERAENQALAKEGLSADSDLFGPIIDGAKERWPWLCINLITAFIATRSISLFENTIQQLVALATLMPIVASVGGNTGNQTAALVIRGLASKQVHRDNITFIYRKELIIGLMNGLLWGTLLGLFAWLLYQNTMLGLVMMMAVTINLILAAFIGITVPFTLDRLNKDPAMGSSVVLTFVTDSMGFFLFLGLASLVLI